MFRKNFLSKQLFIIDVYILNKSMTSHNKKLQQKLSSQMKSCSLPTFTVNETINNFTQYELSKEGSDLLKASLYFSPQPDKV